MFADLDEKIELDLINERASAAIQDSMAEKKLADKMTIEQVCAGNIEYSDSTWHVMQPGQLWPISVHTTIEMNLTLNVVPHTVIFKRMTSPPPPFRIFGLCFLFTPNSENIPKQEIILKIHIETYAIPL